MITPAPDRYIPNFNKLNTHTPLCKSIGKFSELKYLSGTPLTVAPGSYNIPTKLKNKNLTLKMSNA